MRKAFVSVMCLLMLLTGCANESDVKMNDGALPAAQMDVVQNDVPQPTVAVDVRKVDTTEPVAEIKTETVPAKETATETPQTAVPQPQQESKSENVPMAQEPKVEVIKETPPKTEALVIVDSAKTESPTITDSAKTDAPVIIDSAKTDVPVIVDSAKTDVPTIIDSAKTDPQAPVVIETPVTPQPAAKTADLGEVMDAANAYAANEYGVIIDTGLGFDNSGYRFPAYILASAPQSDVVAKAKGIVDYTFQQLMVVNRKTVEDVRSAGFDGNVYAYMDGESIVIYFFYD